MRLPWTIDTARQAIAAGTLKPSALVAECLRRIDRWDKSIQAWVMVDRPGALAEAERQDQLAPAKLANLPLAGIPLGVKDIVDVAGMPTRAGSTLTPETPVGKDATVVARLRAAGAIILGKTVTTEFASIDPAATRNPWHLEHTPGGSSSGSAAAVALGMCLGAVGSQVAGSVIRPAAFCGVYGVKPTMGRIDRTGTLVSTPSLDHIGALAGSVAGLELLWRVMADPPRAAKSAAKPASEKPAEHHHAHWHLPGHHKVQEDPGFPQRPPRLGIVRSMLAEASPEVLLVVEMTLGWLESHGVELNVATLPVELDEIQAMHRTIMTVEMARYHGEQYAKNRNHYGRLLGGLIEEGLSVESARYEAARNHQTAFQEELAGAMRGVDAWVMPATKTTAPARLDTTGDPRANIPWSYAGVPAITLPAGVAKDNMPVGLQLASPAGTDDFLLSIAGWCQERIAFGDGPAMLAEAE